MVIFIWFQPHFSEINMIFLFKFYLYFSRFNVIFLLYFANLIWLFQPLLSGEFSYIDILF